MAPAAVVIVVLMGVGVSRLKPAAPGVDRATLWIDTVQRGPMIRQVRGTGTLVPEDLRWIPAATSGRVERIIVQTRDRKSAATPSSSSSAIPTLEQELQDAAAEGEVGRGQPRPTCACSSKPSSSSATRPPRSSKPTTRRRRSRRKSTSSWPSKQLVSTLTLQQSQLDKELLASRLDIAKQQLAKGIESMEARLAARAIRPSISFAR